MFVESLIALAATATLAPAQDNPPAERPTAAIGDPGLSSPENWAEKCEPWDEWDKPGPAFRITHDVYYVGTCGITVLLVETDSGYVLIDTGTRRGMFETANHLSRMLVKRSAISVILYSHEHFDHVGGMALAQRYTGAPVLVPAGTVEVFRTGKDDQRDPQAGMHEPMEPVPNVIPIDTSEQVHIGGISFTPIATPGHTPGALSWQWTMCKKSAAAASDRAEGCVTIVYADSLSPVSSDDYRFSDHPDYLDDYRAGLQRLREVECDILLTPHPSASKMIERARTRSMLGGMTCVQYADAVEARLDARLAKEAAE